MSKYTMLLADDSVTVRKVVDLTFAEEDIDVISVGDGNSAMDRLREGLPDLVLADVNMPGMNGYEICEKVKQMSPERGIPVVLLVGSFEPFDDEEAGRVGADGYITKPFESIGQLVDKVTSLLGSRAEETPAFEKTEEYPSDTTMVVGSGEQQEGEQPAVFDRSFDDGFEDETIQTEYVGSGAAEPALERVYSEDSAAEGSSDVPEEEPDLEASRAEESFEPVAFVESPDPDQLSAEGSTDEAAEMPGSEDEFAEAAGAEGFTDFQVGSAEGEAAAESAFADGRTEELSSADSGQTEYGTPAEEHSPDFSTGAVTVQLDEADLLELPIGGGGFESGSDASDVSDTASADLSAESISDELVSRIAERVVERLSEKAIREIAWEVVPEMAELIIRKMAEQKFEE